MGQRLHDIPCVHLHVPGGIADLADRGAEPVRNRVELVVSIFERCREGRAVLKAQVTFGQVSQTFRNLADDHLASR